MVESQQDFDTDDDPDELPCINLCRTSGKNKLDLCSNQLHIIPNGIFKLTHLQYLYLEDNLIKEIPLKLCENLTHLIWFDIRRNQLKRLPENISLLENLKHLLLEGNQIDELPLQLGSLKNLSGLNLRYNPLKFPSKDIVAKGPKEIIKYLREHCIESEKFEHNILRELSEEAQSLDVNVKENNKRINKLQNEQATGHQYPVGYYANDISDDLRRLSLEDNMLQLLRYSVNSLEIKERKIIPKCSLPALRSRNLYLEPIKNIPKSKEVVGDGSKFGYMRKEPPKLRYQQEIDRAAKRSFNEKADKNVQTRKNKRLLDDWRKKNGSKGNKKNATSSNRKHEIIIPYGHDILTAMETTEESKVLGRATNIHAQKKSSMARLSMDEQLEERIKEHVQNIKNWRRQHNSGALSIDEQLSATAQNLEKAQKLQKQLHEKRAKEYRFRAFTAGNYAPPAHTPPIQKK